MDNTQIQYELLVAHREVLKHMMVQSAETPDNIATAIRTLGDDKGNIQGRHKSFNVERMVRNAALFFTGEAPARSITSVYGLRQQAIYIKYYLDLEKTGLQIKDHDNGAY